MSKARRRRVAVATLCAAALVAACTGEATPGSTPSVAEPVTEGADVRGGDGACTEALREGPLIDPGDSTLGDPPPGAEPLPVVNLPRLDSCELSSTADWVGRPLVVNFWASWCGPCREEMPELDDFGRDNAGAVDVVGVTTDFRQSDATDFLDEVPVDFDSWFDPDGQVLAREVSVRSMPTTLFVDGEGVIVHRHHGEISREELDAAVADHLDVRPAQAAS